MKEKLNNKIICKLILLFLGIGFIVGIIFIEGTPNPKAIIDAIVTEKTGMSLWEIDSKDIGSYRKKYIIMLNNIEEEMNDLDYSNENKSVSEMDEIEITRYEKWDNKLNEIFDLLRGELPSSEKDELINKQREWITYRDNAADRDANEIEGPMAVVEKNKKLANLTKDRCYYLVDNYMD